MRAALGTGKPLSFVRGGMRTVLLVVAAIANFAFGEVLAVSEKVDMALGCKTNPLLVDSCFSVQGKLSTYNGNPSLRIWPKGTHRLLGVIDDGESKSIPPNTRSLVGFGRDVWGNFVVCPFSKAREGHMQFVCVEAASNVRVYENRPYPSLQGTLRLSAARP